MVRDVRIKEFRFSTESLTSDADGNIDVYTDHPLNGRLWAIHNAGADNPGSWAKIGSLTFSISGADQTIYVWKSGPTTTIANEGVVTADTHFPRASLRMTSGSPLTEYDTIPMNSVIRLVGSGLGDSKSGLGINIAYI